MNAVLQAEKPESGSQHDAVHPPEPDRSGHGALFKPGLAGTQQVEIDNEHQGAHHQTGDGAQLGVQARQEPVELQSSLYR